MTGTVTSLSVVNLNNSDKSRCRKYEYYVTSTSASILHTYTQLSLLSLYDVFKVFANIEIKRIIFAQQIFATQWKGTRKYKASYAFISMLSAICKSYASLCESTNNAVQPVL